MFDSVDRYLAKASFTYSKKKRVLRQIQRLIRANVQLGDALDNLYDLYSDGGKKKSNNIAVAVKEWRRAVDQGQTLASGMRPWLATSEFMILEAGERGGNLDTAFSEALEAGRVTKEITRTVVAGTLYPIVLIFLLIGVMYGFSIEVIPAFAQVLEPQKWTGNAAILYDISQVVVTWTPIVVPAIFASIIAIVLTMPILIGPIRVTLDRFPPWSIYKVVQGASFMISLRGFLSAGIPTPDALRKIHEAGNPYMRERVRVILRGVNSGKNLGDAMRYSGHRFPDPDINGEISIYSGLDNFEESLKILAQEWIDGSVQTAQDTSRVLGNTLLVLLALTIMYLAGGLIELQQLITSSVGS